LAKFAEAGLRGYLGQAFFHSSLERLETIHPTMPQKRQKYMCTKTFRGGLGLKTTRQAYHGLLNGLNGVNYHNLPVWVHLSVSEDKPHILGNFGVSSL